MPGRITREEKAMPPEKAKKCAHPVCSCTTSGEKYCLDCRCEHASCKSKIR
jgi:hypothetical protein